MITFSMNKSSTLRKFASDSGEHPAMAGLACRFATANPSCGALAACAPQNENSRRDVDDDFVETGNAGERAAVFFPFLHRAFAVGGADHNGVIIGSARRPAAARAPKRPGEIATCVVNLGIIPS